MIYKWYVSIIFCRQDDIYWRGIEMITIVNVVLFIYLGYFMYINKFNLILYANWYQADSKGSVLLPMDISRTCTQVYEILYC